MEALENIVALHDVPEKKGLTNNLKMSNHFILFKLKGLSQKSEVGSKEGARLSTMY